MAQMIIALGQAEILNPRPALTIDAHANTVAALQAIDARLRWLSSWTIHNAKHLRPKRDGMKVGNHQLGCASMTAIMAFFYLHRRPFPEALQP